MIYQMKILVRFTLLFCLFFPLNSLAQEQSFNDWLAELREEALQLGISQQTLSASLDGLEPIERVVELDGFTREALLKLLRREL